MWNTDKKKDSGVQNFE